MLDQSETELLSRKLAARSRATGRKLTPEQRTQLVKDFIAEDLSMAALAKRYGVTPQTVAYHLQRNLSPPPNPLEPDETATA